MKKEFLKYIGDKDSLAGYSRSYKLVLYKAFFSLMDDRGVASGYKITEFFRNFYIDRVQKGLKADENVDGRIANINQSSVQDVYDVILVNPFKHISERGYLSRQKDNNGKEQFVLNQELLKELTKENIKGILDLVEHKLELYYSKIDRDEQSMKLHDLIYRWMNEYAEKLAFVKANSDFKNPFRDIIAKEIPENLKAMLPIVNPYTINGSYGVGRWTDVPWIAVFDSRITDSAQKGVYIVYLLNKDTKTLYLTLNQGATAQNSKSTAIQGALKFTGIASSVRGQTVECLKENAKNIRAIIGDKMHLQDDINSGSAAYDAGCIYHKKYNLDTLPNDAQLISDLREFIALYAEYYDKAYGDDWTPTVEEYTPGITKEIWIELLNDRAVFTADSLKIMAQVYALGGKTSCSQLAETYGKTLDYYRNACGVHLAERVHKKTKCPLWNKENAKYWPILFFGKDEKNGVQKRFLWKLRDELSAALEEINIMQYLDDIEERKEELTVKDTINQIKEYIAAKGFNYEDGLVENFYLSLKSKPFVILAGTSGTGKTRLVKLFAEAVGATTENSRYKMVSVRPDWSDSTDLFGHVDLNGKFVPGAIIDFIKKAESDSDYPHFLCLDEMNLARVEYYLSDILSVIETRDFVNGSIQSDPLMPATYCDPDKEAAKIYATVRLPENLYIIGTVNMDETTFPFSRKVLDRANTIEFSYVDLMPNFDDLPQNKKEALALNNRFLKTEYLLLGQCWEDAQTVNEYCLELQKINAVLQKANAHVGYRVRDEIVFYLLNNKKHDLLAENEAMDNEIMQKILPRIQGGSASVKTMLCELFKICAGDYDGYQVQSDNISDKMRNVIKDDNQKIKYRHSAEKIELMTRRFEEDGFTSYWL